MRSLTGPAFVPDALLDTTSGRGRAANRRLGYGRGLLPRLLLAGDHDLILVTVPLGYGPGADLYRSETGEQARAALLALLGPHPYWGKLERGRRGLLHVHALTTRHAVPTLPLGTRWKRVPDPLGLMHYLGKPADGRACRRRERGRWRVAPADEVEAATLDYLTARRAGRLPWLSWTRNLPRLGG